MSQPIYQISKEKELQKREVPLNTIIAPENYSILLTKDSLRYIANNISNKTGRKFTTLEVDQLVNYITVLRPGNCYGITLDEAYKKIADLFLERNRVKKEEYDNIDEYQKKELNQLSNSENPYKYGAFADRRGNALIDAERMKNKNGVKKNITESELAIANYETLKMIKDFLDPESITELTSKFSSTFTTFLSINLSHQTVPLDSRNRLLTNTSTTEYTWNVHTAGQPGHLGDIKMQDTIQQVIQIQIGSFWLPLLPVVGSYYKKVRMLIKEFQSQSVSVTEFLDPDQTQPTVYFYHFEFDITETAGDKVLLVPINKIYTFRKPFAQVNTLTISFRYPFTLLQYTPDRGTFNITGGSSVILTITSDTSHGLSTGDLIYIINSSNTLLNRTIGYFVSKLSNTQVSIAVTSTTETNITVYYGSKRVYFPIEFTSLEQ